MYQCTITPIYIYTYFSGCKHLCLHVYTPKYLYHYTPKTLMHVSMHIGISIYIHICTYIPRYSCTRIPIYIYMYLFSMYICILTCAYMSIDYSACLRVYIYIHIHIYAPSL